MKNNTATGLVRKPPMIAPSVLSADFSKLGQEVQEVEKGGADWIHLDVMDGHFVPNLTFGAMVPAVLKKVTPLPLDCHLMVSRPEDWVEEFAAAGARGITVHAEATVHLHRLLSRIRELGCRAGVSLNPATPLSAIESVMDQVDLVLVMSVNPGFGGQKFIPSVLEKVKRLHAWRTQGVWSVPDAWIQMDGGITPQTIGACYAAGADVFVAGSAVFGLQDRQAALQELKRSALLG